MWYYLLGVFFRLRRSSSGSRCVACGRAADEVQAVVNTGAGALHTEMAGSSGNFRVGEAEPEVASPVAASAYHCHKLKRRNQGSREAGE